MAVAFELGSAPRVSKVSVAFAAGCLVEGSRVVRFRFQPFQLCCILLQDLGSMA